MTPDAKLLSIEIGRIAAALQSTNKLRADQLLQISREVAQLATPSYVQGGWSPVEMSAENHGPVTIVEPGELVCALDPDGKLMGFRIPHFISHALPTKE